ncbi:MAG: hypothetical protein EOM91_19610 [Sphingobacteriia bacterium]|nr:hypothetical protein [Sphingobacteriia bacterium]
MKTAELLMRVREDYGVELDRRTVDAWCHQPENPLPQTRPAMRGQARNFDWDAVKPWIEWRLVGPGGMTMSHIKTISDLQTRIRMGNRWRRAHGLPPPLPGGTWAEEWHP